MNKDQAEGKWKEFNAKVKQQWGKLTDDEVTQAEGNMDELPPTSFQLFCMTQVWYSVALSLPLPAQDQNAREKQDRHRTTHTHDAAISAHKSRTAG